MYGFQTPKSYSSERFFFFFFYHFRHIEYTRSLRSNTFKNMYCFGIIRLHKGPFTQQLSQFSEIKQKSTSTLSLGKNHIRDTHTPFDLVIQSVKDKQTQKYLIALTKHISVA